MAGRGVTRYEWDTSDVDHHLNRLGNGPDERAVFDFEATFQGQFSQVLADVHIDTGSLRESGHTDTRYNKFRFYGEMSFGGPSTGIYPNVRYAQIEVSRTGLRGVSHRAAVGAGDVEATSHDFMRSARGFESGYVDVITDFYRSS